MAGKNYLVLGTSAYSLTKPDFSTIPPPPIFQTVQTTSAFLKEFTDNLHNWTVNILATTDTAIRAELRTKAKNHLRGTGVPAPLSANNPIVDVYVNHSRPSGEGDVWRDATSFSIHPVTLLNYQAQGPIPVAIAPEIPNPAFWISADVTASKV